MKVLFFTKYTRKGASSRLRTFQFLDYFMANGIACVVNPFFDDEYLDEVYRYKRHNKRLAFKSFLRRLGALTTVKRYDLVVIEKELFPYFPSVFERLLKIAGVKYVVDYDDAIFHNYDVSGNPLIRKLLGSKIRNVVRRADLVIAGNEYLRASFERFGAKKIAVIPTVIDTTRYALKEEYETEVFTIGWIGSPITFKYLHRLKEVFERISARHAIKVVYVGSNATLGLPVESTVPWSEEQEHEIIRSFDAGIMPLEDNIWERGKCGYKLIQYMGCGVPVVGTPLGVNDSIIVTDVNGYKAVTLEEWELSLETLIQAGAARRKEMGQQGRKMIEEGYSLQKFAPVWVHLLKALTSKDTRS